MTLTAVQAQNQTFDWTKSMGGFGNEYLVEITTDQAGNVYNTGHFEGTADFDPALGTFELTSPANNWDIFISMLDKNGNFIGARRMGGTSGDYGKSITTDTKGNIYTTGYFSGTADFNPDLPSTFNFTSLGSSDVFISKLRPCSSGDTGGDCVLSNIEDGQTTTKPLFYPNPALDILHINLEAVSDVRILDFTGKILLNEHLKSNKLDISRIKPGIYLLELNSTNTTRTVKLTVE